MIAVLTAGAVCVLIALLSLPTEMLDLHLLVLVAFTIGLGSRMTLKIPSFNSHVAVSDTFIFLALLIYGGEVAILLAAVEAVFSSWRFCRLKKTVLFNAAAMALSTSAVVVALKVFGLYSESQLHGYDGNLEDFFIVLSVLALTQFLVNTALASIYDQLQNDTPLWETWTSKYIWTFFSYFVGAAGAGMLVRLSDSVGYTFMIATLPVIFFVYLTYRMYLSNVQMSIQQARQAEEYAAMLQDQSTALRESEERFRSAFDHAPIGIALVSPSGTWLKVNHALCEILGYSKEELLLMDFQSVIFAEDLGNTLLKINSLRQGRVPHTQTEQRYIHKSGRTVWTSWSVSASGDSSAADSNLIFQIQDITARKVAEAKLQHEATHDALTGLPNRSLFSVRLEEALLNVRRGDGRYRASILFIDLDRFKFVNDSLGHIVGDQLLIGIAERLRKCMRPSDMVARLGGDEFVILVQGVYDVSEVLRIADRIQREFGEPFDLGGHEVYSSASIGILHASDSHRTSEEMMRDADTAMYQAKRAGKARHEVFDDEMHAAAKETLQLETDLRRAVEKQKIRLMYQPIYSLVTGEIESLEALARWDHPDFGMIPPAKFIALAEEIGLIGPLCEQLLIRACTEVGALRRESDRGRGLKLSMNLSCRQFAQPALVDNIIAILEANGFPPDRLNLEITESVLFEYQETAIKMLERLCSVGIEISVDDFGTGYSNLGYLMKLPITTLKIDRSFTHMIDRDGGNAEIVRAIVFLSRNLGLNVIAEGVESSAQLEFLKRLECSGAQGFLLAEPMTFEEITGFMDHYDQTALASDQFNAVTLNSMVQ